MYQLKVVAEIRKQRLIRGFSQENMASELGVSVRTYSKLERGQTALTVNRLFEIALIMKVSPCIFLQEQERF